MITIKNISVLDTSIATQNIGDEIIMDAVVRELHDVFVNDMFLKIPTHEIIGVSSLSLIRHSEFGILGGSNILSSAMNKYKQWKIKLYQSYFIKHKIILLGVGWRNYQQSPNFYTKALLKNLLNKNFLHSVRDSYTEEKLKKEGVKNVINTACPTMWRLTPAHCREIAKKKADKVVFTLTDYSKDHDADVFLINSLLNNYNEVYFWVQSRKDLQYLHELHIDLSRIQIIPPNLNAYTDFLQNNNCDYVGTRLHGGIRALQNKKRTIIIGVDNRAIEKQKDFNLKVIKRINLKTNLEEMILSEFETIINIPLGNIEKWKKQFQEDN